MSTATVSSTDACRVAGISYRQLDYWVRNGILQPTVDADGPGTQRRWSDRDVAVAGVLGRLAFLWGKERNGSGDRVYAIAALVDYVRAHGPTGVYELVPGVTLDLDVLCR